jgi:xylan 1,4-beta-xylosidase
MNRLKMPEISILAGLTVLCLVFPTFAVNLTVNGSTSQGDVPHFWSRCVGTGGAQLCLKKEWQDAAKIGVTEAGFKAFRGHLILSASNPISWSGSGTPTYNWATFDKIYDFLVDTLKTTPVVELSAMPTALRSGSNEWSPPKNYEVWGDLIKNVVAHCVSRYGKDKVDTWYWEVWNEWDYSGFWEGGTESQYYQLYQKAVEGAISADPDIKIGGPSTTGSSGTKLSGFLDFCKTNNLKVDLVTNHCYGGGGSGSGADPKNVRDDNRARSDAIKSSGKKLLSFNTEYNSSYSGQGGGTGANLYSMDNHKNAPYVVKCVKLILDDAATYRIPEVFSYWVISDVFDEGSYIEGHSLVPFGQVFGLINYQGVKKATFNAFKMLNMMGTTRLQLSGGSGTSDGVDGFATLNKNGSEVAVIIYNSFVDFSGAGSANSVNLTVSNLPLPKGKITVNHYRVDETLSNAYNTWVKQGKPSKPSTAQWDEMKTASNLAELKPQVSFDYSGGAYTDTFTLPGQSVSLLLFKSDAVPVTVHRPALKTGPELSLRGMMLRVTNSRESPMDIVLYSLDGKKMKRLKISGDCCDLRRLLPKGIFLVLARLQGSSVLGRIVVD